MDAQLDSLTVAMNRRSETAGASAGGTPVAGFTDRVHDERLAAEPMARAMLGVSWLFVLGGFMVVSWLASRAAHTATPNDRDADHR